MRYAICSLVVAILFAFYPQVAMAQEPDFDCIPDEEFECIIVEELILQYELVELFDVFEEVLSEIDFIEEIEVRDELTRNIGDLQFYIISQQWGLAVSVAESMAVTGSEYQEIVLIAEGIKRALQGALLDAQDSLWELSSYVEENAADQYKAHMEDNFFEVTDMLDQGRLSDAIIKIDGMIQLTWEYLEDGVRTNEAMFIIEELEFIRAGLLIERPC